MSEGCVVLLDDIPIWMTFVFVDDLPHYDAPNTTSH